MKEDDGWVHLTKQHIFVGISTAATLIVAYVSAWVWMDGNFDYNRDMFIEEHEVTRAQVINQADWTRSQLLAVIQECTKH